MKKDGRNTGGGIEGMPLQLMILILVATMCTAIIIGWMGSIDTPKTMTVECVSSISEYDLTSVGLDITVADGDGNLVEGATVILSGLNVKMEGGTAFCLTDENGVAHFRNLTIRLSSDYGWISIDVTKTGYTYAGNAEILVTT